MDSLLSLESLFSHSLSGVSFSSFSDTYLASNKERAFHERATQTAAAHMPRAPIWPMMLPVGGSLAYAIGMNQVKRRQLSYLSLPLTTSSGGVL